MDKGFLRRIDQAALNAWPTARQMLVDGWVLRFAGGKSKRVNSVNPYYPSSLPLERKIYSCEEIFASEDLPCLFRISAELAEPGLENELQTKGYTCSDLTHVMGKELEEPIQTQTDVSIFYMALDDWFDIRDRFITVDSANRLIHQGILKCIVPETVLLGAFQNEQPVACGMGVIEGDLLGFYSIYTASAARRKGYASLMMNALTNWGLERGATFGYLLVEDDNLPALSLYVKLGYQCCYSYVYYQKRNNQNP